MMFYVVVLCNQREGKRGEGDLAILYWRPHRKAIPTGSSNAVIIKILLAEMGSLFIIIILYLNTG